jgi:ATP-dependent exoDNAse (exonuclease V) beta subunit
MLQDKDESWLLSHPDDGQATWAERTFQLKTRDLEPAEPQERTVAPGVDYPQVQPREHPPARLSPSQMPGEGSVSSLERIGSRLPLSGDPDLNRLGEAIHAFYAADRQEYKQQIRLKLAAETLIRWECGAYLAPEQIVRSADSLYHWIQNKYPHAAWKRELPVMNRQENGTQVFGFIDLLLETGKEQVIIDHKAYPGSIEDAKEKTQEYMGQLAAYGQCLRKVDGGDVVSFVHYPVIGCLVGLEVRRR